ncbi:MAG: class C sortase [Ruminococcus sp.]|nr:class C sortase [Ruminococcus sp.]
MKNKLAIFGIILIFIAGVGVLSYPLVSSIINNIASRAQAEEYTKTTKLMSTKENKALWDSAVEYNESLSNNMIITDPFDEEAYKKIGAYYQNSLNVNGEGLIGYVDIPKINVYLPVYHGTNDEVLDRYAGHLQNTSLPVGGPNTHAVISAHTGFPGETFFDYLTDLEEGDEFYIHVLDRTLKYEVDQVKVVLPEVVDTLRIIDGEDYLTLLTCTPYGMNTHRLHVRGKRVEFDDSTYVTNSASLAAFDGGNLYFLGYKIPFWMAGVVIGIIILIFVIFVVIIIKNTKKSKGKRFRKETGKSQIKDGD